MIAVVDYGAGNLFSVQNALQYLDADYIVTKSKSEIESADGIILPGVGAFPSAMQKLGQTGLINTLRRSAGKKPFLGICLGMQMLFEKSFEFGKCEGLGLIPGTVEKMEPDGLKIPHMGWNSLVRQNLCPLLEGIEDGEYVYFVHSYQAVTKEDAVAAYCEYGGHVPALVQRDGVFGAQFHPEKSGGAGLLMLQNFWRLTK